jgi:hypothetical protein
MYYSTNGGQSFVSVDSNMIFKDIREILVKDSYVFVGTKLGGIYRAPGDCSVWQQCNSGLPPYPIVTSMAVYQQYLFAGIYDVQNTSGKIFVSADNGNQWEELGLGLPNHSWEAMLVYGNDLYAGSGLGVWKFPLNSMTREEFEIGARCRIYPNPGYGVINVESDADVVSAEVVNMMGEVLLAEDVPSSTQNLTLNLSGLSSGIYFIRVQTNHGCCMEKLIVSRPAD